MAAAERLAAYNNKLAREARSRGWPYIILPVVRTAKIIGVNPRRIGQLLQKFEEAGFLVISQEYIAHRRARRYIPKIIRIRRKNGMVPLPLKEVYH